MRISRDVLPLGCAHWPVLPGERLSDLDFSRYANAGEKCRDRRNSWFCTREPLHELPHVAVFSTVAGVWDQLWFADAYNAQSYPTSEVPAEALNYSSRRLPPRSHA
jgi:hypothetical protein